MGMIKVAVCGEVDSGKSTLIGRLLYDADSLTLEAKEEFEKSCAALGRGLEYAYLLDSFQEERRQEFTLDTTQAFWKKAGREILFIDVPGHRELLKNMFTGSSSAQRAVLVVDINKSLQEQTRRHLYILKFLGIEKITIAVNKIDSIGYDQGVFLEVKKQIEKFLAGLKVNVGHIIPVSAKESENLISRPKHFKWYAGPSLIEALGEEVKQEEDFDFRFFIQDVYKLKGQKICVGRIASGKAKRGDLLKVLPSGVQVRLEKIFNKNKKAASCGQSVGLLFDRRLQDPGRGQVFYSGRAPSLATQIPAKVFCLASINLNEWLSISCATQDAPVKVALIKECTDSSSWQPNKDSGLLKVLDAADVILQTNEPLVFEKFTDLPQLGRFVLKKGNEVCAVGIIG